MPRKPTRPRTLRDEISDLLEQRALSQRQLARELDLDPGWFSRAVRGERPLELSDLERIANVLGVEPECLTEYRRRVLIQAMDDDPALIDQFFEQLNRRRARRRQSR